LVLRFPVKEPCGLHPGRIPGWGERGSVQYRDEVGTGETDDEGVGSLSGRGLEIELTVGFIGALPG